MPENRDSRGKNAAAIVKNRKDRNCSFHARYAEQCTAKNCAPLTEIRKNNKDKATLDFFGDKLSITEWLIIAEAIGCDQILSTMAIRLRKCLGPVLDQMDSERKAKLCKDKPVIYSKFIFANLIDNIGYCVASSKNLSVLQLEGLPLSGFYVESIAKSLAQNTSIRSLSFARSTIYDEGCEAICHTIKYLNNIEKLNLSDTGLTTKGAEHVANMINIQKIGRYTDGWQLSLRYSEIDINAIAGLHTLSLAKNPQIGNEGLRMIVEVLKDDVLVKSVDMENCGLTDIAANFLLDCLSVNSCLREFNIGGNAGLSKFLLRQINDHLKRDDEEETRTPQQLLEALNDGEVINVDLLAKNSKLTTHQLIDQLKLANEQLQLEKRLRSKAEELNDKLTTQIKAYRSRLETQAGDAVPHGHTLVEKEVLQRLVYENQEIRRELEQNVMTNEVPGWTVAESKETHSHDNRQQVQFMNDTPEVSESPRAGMPGQPIRVRKVRSEITYAESCVNSNRRNETKSDYDYGTDSDGPTAIETNIGDTLANNNDCVEVDDISLFTFCCHGSDTMSTDSATLRCDEEYLRQDQTKMDLVGFQTKEYGQGEGSANTKLTPRSMFLGQVGQKKSN